MQGRLHYYEGLEIQEVVYPLQYFLFQGIRHVLLFNAAGSVNEGYEPGDWMVIRDHINLFGANPLRGPNMDHLGPRFAPMEGVYDAGLREIAHPYGPSVGQQVHEGVYVAVPGPSYETAAEIRMLQLLGADAVGMSTVPEAITAYHAGARIFAMSVISNWGSGLRPQQKQIQADHVTATVASSIDHLPGLVDRLIQNLN
jgi:purine-nucleoside phosphorylase